MTSMIFSGTISVRSQHQVYVEIVAPIIMGTILNWTLYGVLICQFYIYTYNFPDDSQRFKYLAYGVVFLETVQSGLAVADLFYLIGSGDIIDGYVVDSPLSPWVGPILVGGVVAVIVQLFFAYRIWVLSNKKSRWLCLTILFFSAVSLISEIIGSILLQVPPLGLYGGVILSGCALIWLTGSVVTDGIITISMLYLLKIGRSEGTSLSTTNAISKIVRLTVETNLLTTTVAIMALVSFAATTFQYGTGPSVNWSYFPLAIIGKLYANALFASLNNRIAIRQDPRPNAAIRIPDAALSRGRPQNDISDCMYTLELDRPPSVMIFNPPKEDNMRSRESGEDESRDESLIIDIA